MLSQYPLNVMKSWIVWEEKWCPCDTNTTWNIRIAIAINFIRWIHHFKHKVSSHLFGRLEQAVTIRMSILLMLQLISHSTLYSHNTVDISLGCLPDFLTTEPCGYHILRYSMAIWADGYFPFGKYIFYSFLLCDVMCMARFWVHPARV